MQKSGPPPEAVGTRVAEEQTWEAALQAVASVVSVKGVSVANEAAGAVTRIHFESGQVVKAGQVLVELDSAVERAQLASLKARKQHAEITLKRSTQLANEGVISRAQFDADDSTLKGLEADARALQAQIEQKIVRAPFSGRLGIRAVNVGQYLAPGTTITALESTESMYVDFTLPQQYLPLLKVGMPVRATLDAGATVDGRPAPVSEGTISAIDPAIDARTRAVKVRASVPNGDERLRTGMFLNVSVVLPERLKLVVVPATSVVHASYGDSVFVVEPKKGPSGSVVKGPDGKPLQAARQQFVRLGERRGDFVALLEGVKAGEEVVTAGAFKLRNGASVVVNNNVKTNPELNPRPENR